MKLKLVLRGDYWYASGSLPNVGRVFKSTGYGQPDKELAYQWCVEYEYECLKHKGRKGLENEPFKKLVDLYVLNKPYLSDKELNAIDIMMRYIASTPIKDVRVNLDDYIYERHATSKLNTICRDVDRRIRAIINFGKERGMCGSFEVDCSEFRVDDTRTVFITIDRAQELIAALPEKYREFETVLLFQGLRFGQAQSLTKRSIVGGQLEIETKKGMKHGRTRVFKIPMFEQVQEVLEKRAKQVSGQRLFDDVKYTSFRYQRIKACERIGLADYRIHDNRSSYITHVGSMLQLSTREAAELLGQSSDYNVKRYWQKRDLQHKIGGYRFDPC